MTRKEAEQLCKEIEYLFDYHAWPSNVRRNGVSLIWFTHKNGKDSIHHAFSRGDFIDKIKELEGKR